MKVLVIGGGGREHALTWKISQSPLVKRIYCAPGNAGTASTAKNLPIPANDIDSLLEFALRERIDLTVVGPEQPLTMGITNRFREQDLAIVGPSTWAAQLEGSKVFAKEFMRRHAIPTGEYAICSTVEEAYTQIEKLGMPLVVKADGLAAGKGVVVAEKTEEATRAIKIIMEDKRFGEAGDKVVLEEYLRGEEASFICLTDGRRVLPLAPSQDHKAVFDGDQGPNTGGMGAYSPVPLVDRELIEQVMARVIIPVVEGMAAEGHPYQGFLYAGLMVKDGMAKVLEFNCRLGDPETQPLMVRIKSDLVEALLAVAKGDLVQTTLDWEPRASVCVVLAARGYPGSYEKGMVITGLEEAAAMDGVEIFHAGTTLEGSTVLTSGGRVLGVTALGDELPLAIERAYEAVDKIHWDGKYHRKDIGAKALRA